MHVCDRELHFWRQPPSLWCRKFCFINPKVGIQTHLPTASSNGWALLCDTEKSPSLPQSSESHLETSGSILPFSNLHSHPSSQLCLKHGSGSLIHSSDLLPHDNLFMFYKQVSQTLSVHRNNQALEGKTHLLCLDKLCLWTFLNLFHRRVKCLRKQTLRSTCYLLGSVHRSNTHEGCGKLAVTQCNRGVG